MNRDKYNLHNLLRMLSVLWHLTPELFAIIIVICILSSILPYINILSMQLIIDGFNDNISVKMLILIILATIIANATVRIITGILTKNREKAEAKLELTFQKELYIHEMKFSLINIESTKVKELHRNIEQARMRNGGVETVVKDFETVTKNVMTLIISSLMFFRVFFVKETTAKSSFWTSWIPIILLIGIVIIITMVTFKMQSLQNAKIVELNEKANQANGSAFAYMQFISDYHFGKDIRIYKLGNFLCNYFDDLWKSSIGYSLTKKLGKEIAKIPCITSIGNGILNILIYVLAIVKAYSGEISVGNVVVYIGSIQSFLQTMIELIGFVGEILVHGELMKPYLELLDMEEEVSNNEGKVVPEKIEEISFIHVYFRYQGEKRWTLEDISFSLKMGEKIALVGENGSGKSTIVKLLCRFYEPERGRIELNGVNIQKYNQVEYRKIIGSVFQDFSLSSLKLGENIACTNIYKNEKVESILHKVGLKEWMTAKDVSIESYLFKEYSGDGVEISGGEKQKIAIARAVYKDAQLIVLDEPTAALDPRSESDIYHKFNMITRNKTCVVISHRLSNCIFCNKILVLHNGRVIQMGAHEELLNSEGKYKELWDAQAKLYFSK